MKELKYNSENLIRIGGKQKRNYILFFCFACSSTMSVLCIHIGNRYVSIFTLLVPVLFLTIFFQKSENGRFTRDTAYLLAFFLISLLSTIIGTLYFSNMPEYRIIALGYLPKILIYMVFSYLVSIKLISRKNLEALVYGLLCGAILNLLWASIDGIIFHLFRFSINNMVFSGYIQMNNIRYGMLSLITEGGFRASGFNSDPANIGMMVAFVFGYALLKRKYYLILLAFISLTMSQSVLGLAGCIMITLYIIIKNHNSKILISLVASLIVIAVAYIIIMNTSYSNLLSNITERVLSKLNDASIENSRIIYNFKILEAAFSSPLSFILGTGFGTASYPYASAGLISMIPYDPESTYISYLFDTGILGCVLYITFLISAIRKESNKLNSTIHSIIFSGLIATFVSNFFYHYTLFAPHMVMFLAYIIVDNSGQYERVYLD